MLESFLPHAGKALTQPLFVLTAAAAFAIAASLRKTTNKRPLLFVFSVVLLLAALGTNIVADAIFQSLAVEPVGGTPDVIVVASGGFRYGATPDLDVLHTETEARVAAAVAAWRQHPTARLVMAGTVNSGEPRSEAMVELMRARAICAGVPASAIVLDPNSTNTREHAERLLAMPGITPTTRVGIATSYYHMRRALHVFRRHFRTVIPYPTKPRPQPRTMADFLPQADALERSTEGIHEWIGLAWYAAQDAREDVLLSSARRSRRLQ